MPQRFAQRRSNLIAGHVGAQHQNVIGVQAGFERTDAHTRRDPFNDAAERAGVLRDFVPMFYSVRMQMNVERF